MPAPIQYPWTDGARQSFPSLEAKVNNKVYFLKSLNYSRTRTRGEARGNHPDPLGKTRGSNAYEGEMEMYLAEFNALQADLAAGYGDKTFQIIATYSEAGLDTITDTLLGVTIDSTESTNQQGDDATTRKVKLHILKILFNGVEDVAVPLKAPPG